MTGHMEQHVKQLKIFIQVLCLISLYSFEMMEYFHYISDEIIACYTAL